MPASPRIAGLILAGGRSSRFGSPKGRALLGGYPLAAHVAAGLRPHITALALAGDAALAADLDAIPLADPRDIDPGPLAGVLSGLDWGTDCDWLVTAPCDAPLLPPDLAPRLIAAAEQSGARLAIASTADGLHPLCAAWRPSLAHDLRARFSASGHPPVHRFAADMGAAIAAFADARAFLNVNTLADLATAASILAARA